MPDFLAKLLDRPWWAVALVLGAALIVFPCIDVTKGGWTPHSPSTLIPVVIGAILLALSLAVYGYSLYQDRIANSNSGLDLTRVHKTDQALWTTIGECEIRVVTGRIEDQERPADAAFALPCNEYFFDDDCFRDPRSALGAYTSRVFDGQSDAFVSLVREECKRLFGPGSEQQKTNDDRAESFGPGRCLLLKKPLGKSLQVALVSTTTQRSGEGLAGRISYLFAGMRELVSQLANERINEVTMPVLGAGHAGISPALALVGLLLAIAEAARYGQGGQRLKKVTVVVFERDAGKPQVDLRVVRRALALIGS